MLYARQVFANFAEQFTRRRRHAHRRGHKNKKPITRLRRRRRDDGRLPRHAETTASRSTKTAFKKDDEFIRAMIHYEIDVALFGIDEARKT